VEQRTEGFLLRSVEYGESDRIVTFLTQDFGKIAMFARAARKSQRRFGGALELFGRLGLRFQDRGSKLATLSSADVLRGPRRLVSRYELIARGSYITELVSESLREREAAPELFQLLDLAYQVLDDPAYSEADPGVQDGWLASVELKLLVLAGYQPRLDSCAACDAQETRRVYWFHAQRGGVLCTPCAQGQGDRLAPSTAAQMSASLGTPVRDLAEVGFTPAEAAQARRVLGGFIRFHLGKELKSARFVENST
jgi:DNA repair protein RecO (recombination protein O)